MPARNQLRSPSRGLCREAEGRSREGLVAAPPLLPTLLPDSCSFTAGPTLQAHKGEAHSKQLLFVWKPLDLHLSFPGRTCCRPAALRPQSAGSAGRERQGNRTSRSGEEERRGCCALWECAHSVISWTPDKCCGQHIQIRFWVAQCQEPAAAEAMSVPD